LRAAFFLEKGKGTALAEGVKMRQKDAIEAVKKAKELAKKRNFTQSVEMMINFTGLDMKKPQNQVSVRVDLPHSTGKGSGKIAIFTKTEKFEEQVKGKADLVIKENEIEKLSKNKAKVAELVEYDALFAEGPAMLTVAKFLGQQLATKGKMPKPVLNINSFDEVLAKAKTQVTVTNKKGKFMPVVQTVVGKEDMKDEEIVENMLSVYETVMPTLPQKKQNIKNVYVKLTMGSPVKVGDVQ
jgi:large subunit ribosomal protein L1